MTTVLTGTNHTYFPVAYQLVGEAVDASVQFAISSSNFPVGRPFVILATNIDLVTAYKLGQNSVPVPPPAPVPELAPDHDPLYDIVNDALPPHYQQNNPELELIGSTDSNQIRDRNSAFLVLRYYPDYTDFPYASYRIETWDFSVGHWRLLSCNLTNIAEVKLLAGLYIQKWYKVDIKTLAGYHTWGR